MSRPAFRLTANAADVTPAIRDRLISLRAIDEAGEQSDSLEIRLDDRDGELVLPPTGAALELALGRDDVLTTIGRYVVDEIGLEGPPGSLVIVAKAADMRASLKAQKSRGFENITMDGLVATIAASHGLTPKVAPSLAGIRFTRLDQTEESDMAFLTRIAGQYDAIAKPAFGHLLMVPRGEARSAAGLALPTVALVGRDIIDWRMRAADRGRYKTVIAHWQDTGGARRAPERAGDGSPAYTIRYTYPTQDQARAAAAGRLAALERGAATLTITTPGRADLAAEGRLTVSGIRTGVDGAWSITRVEHSLDGSGWISRVEAETPKG